MVKSYKYTGLNKKLISANSKIIEVCNGEIVEMLDKDLALQNLNNEFIEVKKSKKINKNED